MISDNEAQNLEPMFIEEDKKLWAEFHFQDFRQAFAFMTHMALYSEQVNHHPLWTNVYNKLTIELSTHDAGNVVTEKDQKWAKEAGDAYNRIMTNT